MKTVRQVLEDKGSDVWSVGPDDSVLDALRVMADRNVGSVMVLSAGNLSGIFSERDYARKVALEGRTAENTSVQEVMTSRVTCVNIDQPLEACMAQCVLGRICVGPPLVHIDQPLEACMAFMTAKRTRHLAVLEHNQLVGVISIGDLVKALISEQGVIIQQLENYLWGHPS